MAYIDKIQVGSTTYDIQDSNLKSALEVGCYFCNGNFSGGAWASNNNAITFFVPVKGGDSIEVVGTSVGSNSPVGIIKGITVPPSNGATPDRPSDPIWSSTINLPKNTTLKGIAPTDGEYLFVYFGTKAGGYNRKPQKLIVNGYDYLETIGKNVVGSIEKLTDDYSNGFNNDIVNHVIQGSIRGGVWSKSTGYSVILKVNPNSAYTFIGNGEKSSPYAGLQETLLQPIDGNQAILSSEIGWTVERNVAANEIASGIIPSDVNYLYFYAGLNNTYDRLPKAIYIDGYNYSESIKANIARLSDEIQNIREQKELYIGELVNGHLTASGIVDDETSPYRVTMKAIVALPYGDKTKIKVVLKDNYALGLRCGAQATNLNKNIYWKRNGDEIAIPSGCNYYAISICNINGTSPYYETTEISPSEDTGVKLIIQPEKSQICDDNNEAEKILSAARLYFSANTAGNKIDKYAVIAHTSDCHGDYERMRRFLDYCDGDGLIDAACVTGDIVSWQPSHQIKWFNDMILNHNVLPAVCVGNHDVGNNSTSPALTDSDVYTFMFNDVATKIGNTTGKTWYYKDIPAKKLRIISVNLYQYGGTSRWYTHFTDEQLAWIVTTLASTPENYGVIMLSHSPQMVLNAMKDQNYPDFFQDQRIVSNMHNAVTGGYPLYDIVDAFIAGSNGDTQHSSFTKTYSQTGSPSSISVTADFSSLNTGVEFVAHLTGHIHEDTICYLSGTEYKQLMLNVTCTIGLYGGDSNPYLADVQDLGRNNTDSTQDAFNVYVIDRDRKTVKVVRIGSNTTFQMKGRKYMEIPYKDI